LKTALIAFSGGLDTSFLVPFARQEYGVDRVITCAVDTGGFSNDERDRIAARSKEVGADDHVLVDASAAYYEQIIKYLIFGNVSRDGYPLCVGAERLIQAQKCLEVAVEKGADAFFHGSTGAGNDQYRFDVAAQVLGRGASGGRNEPIVCIAPIREHGVTREQSTRLLREQGISVPEKNSAYSYNVGLWGVSIGGKETLTSEGLIPDEVWHSQPDLNAAPVVAELTFEQGELTSLRVGEDVQTEPVAIIRQLTDLGNSFGIGRHYHVGTSVPGKKGRLAYESPAADLIYEAHRTLEKHVLTQAQISAKKPLAEELGRLVHEAKVFEPLLADIKAFLASTQRRVTGTARVHIAPRVIEAVTVESPYDLLGAAGATYGEVADAYTGQDAAGAAKLHGFEQTLYASLENSAKSGK
jgi:argininosuccinate synthase